MFKVIFYKSLRGEEFAKEFLDKLPDRNKEKVITTLMYLEKHGNQAKRPYADLLRDKIYELRVHFGGLNVRILYFFDEKLIVLTHGFLKKSDAVPPTEIGRALNIRTDYFKRKS